MGFLGTIDRFSFFFFAFFYTFLLRDVVTIFFFYLWLHFHGFFFHFLWFFSSFCGVIFLLLSFLWWLCLIFFMIGFLLLFYMFLLKNSMIWFKSHWMRFEMKSKSPGVLFINKILLFIDTRSESCVMIQCLCNIKLYIYTCVPQLYFTGVLNVQWGCMILTYELARVLELYTCTR
jgi:hypothetical protein